MGARQRSQVGLVDQLEVIYRDDYRRLERIATAITRNGASGSDAVQDAFVRALRHQRTFRGEGSLRAWVTRIVVTCAHSARMPAVDDAAGTPNEQSDVEGPDYEIREQIQLLPERQRLALFLRYYADMDYATIGDVLGIRPGTVAASIHAAHETIRHRTAGVAS